MFGLNSCNKHKGDDAIDESINGYMKRCVSTRSVMYYSYLEQQCECRIGHRRRAGSASDRVCRKQVVDISDVYSSAAGLPGILQ